jgi:type IV pilus assembly protein PilB
LVLSTLHTNDAVSAVSRLLDLSVDPSLITSCLSGVLAQRLVRKICSACRQEAKPSDDLLKECFRVPPAGMRWYRGTGCAQCNFTSYKGRMAVAELWLPNDNDILLINKGAGLDEIRGSATKSTISMAEDIRERLREGMTNLEELIRTLPYSSLWRFRDGLL